MKLATQSYFWRYSVLTIVGHADTIWSTVSSLSAHSLQLESALLLRILDWYAHVDIHWSWAASIKPSVFPFKLELLSHWWVVALFTSALPVLKGYFPCTSFSLYHFFMSSKLVFLAFFFTSLAAFFGLVLVSISSWAIISWNLNFLLSFTTEWSLWSGGLVVKSLDSQFRGPMFKSTRWLQGRLSLSSFRGQ